MPKKDILNNIFNKKIDCSEDKCTDSSSSQFTINSQFSAKETDMSDTQEANNFPILIPGAPCSPPQKVIINYGVDGGIIDVGSLIQGDNIILTGNTVGRLVGIGDVVIEAVIPPVDLSNYYTKTETDTLLLGKLDVGALDDYYTKTELQTPGGAIVDWSNIANAPDFATDWGSITGDQSVVGNSGFTNTAGYITLSDIPFQVNADWNATSGIAEILNKPVFADVAFSGNYNDLINTPAIPDLTGYATEQWVLDRNYLTGVTWGIITGDQSVIGNAGFSNTANFITADDLPELAEVAYSGDYNDLINLPTIPDLTGYATEQWVIDQDYATEQWVLDQNYITGVTWGDITGLQSVIGNAGFSNTANYITAADVPSQVQTDWNATSGLAQILNKPSLATVATTGDYNDLINQPSIPDLTGYATEAWVTSQGYLTSVPWSFNSNTGDLTINGIAGSLDGRWLERAEGVITPGYGITVNGDLATGMGIELDTTVVDNRYLRKDVSDANGAFKLTLGELESGDAEFTGTVTLGSVATGTTNEILLYGPSGVIQRKTLEFEGSFGVANSGGTKQFDVDLGTNLRFAGTGDTVVSFNSSTNTVTINSIPGQGGSGVITSVFGRTGPAIMAETGDYNTSQVPESGNLYFTQARARATPLSGYSVGSNAAISASDTILGAFGKVQGQINSRVPTSRTVSISGTSGNIAISGTPTQNLGSNAAWTINLATVGSAGANKTKVTTDAYGRVIASAALTMGDLPSGVTQTLSVGTTPGEFSISGGNTVTLTRLGRANIADLSDFNVGQGFYPFYSTTGAVGFPSTVGGGILWNRNATSGQFGGNFALWTAGNDAETLYYVTGTGTGYSSWKTIADRAWVTSQIPTNFVTTNTNQTSGLTGNKTWSGAHIFTSATVGGGNISIVRTGQLVNSSIRYAADSGSEVYAGLGPASTFAIAPQTNMTSSTTWLEVGASGINSSLLSGTGTQMIVANASGVLSRQSIPAVNNGTLTMTTGTGLSGSASFSANQSGNSSFTVAAASGYAIPTTSQISNWNAANNNYFSTTMTGANTLSSHTGDYNTISGAGSWIMGGSSSNAPPNVNNPNFVLLNLYASSSSSPQIALGVGGTGYNTNIWYRNRQTNVWKELADKSDIPTNYVTTNTNQTGLSGTKSWTGHHSISPSTTTNLGSGGNSIRFTRNTSGSYMAIDDASTGVAFLYGYNNSDRQLYLTLGGIEIPASTSITSGPAIFAGNGRRIIGTNSSGTAVAGNGSNGLYLRPDGMSSAVGQVQISPTAIDIAQLSGSGTQMIVANASGRLSRQAIPAVGVTSVSAGNGMNFTTITGTGTVTMGTPGTLTSGTSNSVTSTSHTHALGNDVWGSTTAALSGNLNDYTVAGHRSQTTSANATLANNYPWEGGGGSLINSGGSGTYRTQIFHNRGGTQIAWRARTSGSTWSTWKEFWHSGNLANGTTSQYIRGNGSLATFPSIPAGTVTSVTGGNGLSGTVTSSGSLTLGTPSNITLSSTNSVTTTSHTHNFAPGGTTSQYIRGNGSLATFPSIPSGTVTSVATGSGLTGGPITSSGTISVDSTVMRRNARNTISVASSTTEALLSLNATTNAGSGATLLYGFISTSDSTRNFMFFEGNSSSNNWRVGGNGHLLEGVVPWARLSGVPDYVPTSRTITLTGGTGITVSAGQQSLAANRTWTITNSSPNATHTGDVTGSTSLTIANNAVTTAKIINSAVTHAKYQNIATQRILGRGATGSGNVQELTLGANLSLSTAGVLSATNTVYTLPTATATVLGGIEIFSNTVQSVAANSVTTTASRTYGIQLNSAGQAVVNVPWTNTNTTYTAGNGLVLTGTSFAVGAGSGISVAASAVAVDATVLRTTGNQSASGVKTFTGELVANNLRLGTVANTTTTINMNANNLVRLNAISSNTTYTLSNNSDGRQVQCTVTNSGGSNVSVTVAGAILLGTNIIGAGKSAVISVINFGGGQLRYTVTPEL